MNDTIEVKAGFEQAEQQLAGVCGLLDDLEAKLEGIRQLYDIDTFWAGEAKTKGKQVHAAVQQYEGAIRPIVEKLQAALRRADGAVYDHNIDSRLIGRLRSW